MDFHPFFLFGLFAVVALAIGIYGVWRARKRRQAMFLLAQQLGLRYRRAPDYHLPQIYAFLDRLDKGSNRYAFNIIEGDYQGDRVCLFDYHYETYSHSSKGGRRTHHHYFSFFILMLPQSFPELTIAREGIFSKVAQAFGYDDIDFESHEFSRKFCVRSQDKKFAYDVCNAQMMEYLLRQDDVSLEIEGMALSMGFTRRLKAEEIMPNLKRLKEIRSLLPDYLFSKV